MLKTIIVVGAGFTGCVIARELAELGHKVHIIEARNHVAGNAHDKITPSGVHFHSYGPHLFHTDSRQIAEYMSEKICLSEITSYKHQVKALITPETAKKFALPELVSLPIGPLVTYRMTKSQILDVFYRPYSRKMWNMELEEMDPSIIDRVRFSDVDTPYYFKDDYQFVPTKGYTAVLTEFIKHPNIELHLNTKLKQSELDNHPSVEIFNCAAIDEWFNYKLGVLPYRSIRFETAVNAKINNLGYTLPVMTVNYTENGGKFTRVTDWRRYPLSPSATLPSTGIITYEEPCSFEDNNYERYYPVKDIGGVNRENWVRYLKLAEEKYPNMTFVGRCGRYQYIDMHQAIGQALATVKKFREKQA